MLNHTIHVTTRFRLISGAVAAATLLAMPAGGGVAAAKTKPKNVRPVKVTFVTVPTIGATGAPSCSPAACLLVAQPTGGTFTGDVEAQVTASQAIVLETNAPAPRAVTVTAVVEGTVKGCATGSMLMLFVLSDFTSKAPGEGAKGTWSVIAGSGTGGLAGARGSGSLAEQRGATDSTVTHTGSISCTPG